MISDKIKHSNTVQHQNLKHIKINHQTTQMEGMQNFGIVGTNLISNSYNINNNNQKRGREQNFNNGITNINQVKESEEVNYVGYKLCEEEQKQQINQQRLAQQSNLQKQISEDHLKVKIQKTNTIALTPDQRLNFNSKNKQIFGTGSEGSSNNTKITISDNSNNLTLELTGDEQKNKNFLIRKMQQGKQNTRHGQFPSQNEIMNLTASPMISPNIKQQDQTRIQLLTTIEEQNQQINSSPVLNNKDKQSYNNINMMKNQMQAHNAMGGFSTSLQQINLGMGKKLNNQDGNGSPLYKQQTSIDENNTKKVNVPRGSATIFNQTQILENKYKSNQPTKNVAGGQRLSQQLISQQQQLQPMQFIQQQQIQYIQQQPFQQQSQMNYQSNQKNIKLPKLSSQPQLKHALPIQEHHQENQESINQSELKKVNKNHLQVRKSFTISRTPTSKNQKADYNPASLNKLSNFKQVYNNQTNTLTNKQTYNNVLLLVLAYINIADLIKFRLVSKKCNQDIIQIIQYYCEHNQIIVKMKELEQKHGINKLLEFLNRKPEILMTNYSNLQNTDEQLLKEIGLMILPPSPVILIMEILRNLFLETFSVKVDNVLEKKTEWKFIFGQLLRDKLIINQFNNSEKSVAWFVSIWTRIKQAKIKEIIQHNMDTYSKSADCFTFIGTVKEWIDACMEFFNELATEFPDGLNYQECRCAMKCNTIMKIAGKPIPEEIQEAVINGGFLDCTYLHDGTCLTEAMKRWITVFIKSWKYYLPVHLIPLLLYKRKKLMTEPIPTLKHALWNYIKSLMFMASYVGALKYLLCFTKNVRGTIDGWNPGLSAFFAGFSVTFEPESRRSEIALFILPRFLETLWNFLKRRRLVTPIPGGELLVFALAMGIINYFYQCEQAAIKPTYLSVFKKFWGVN